MPSHSRKQSVGGKTTNLASFVFHHGRVAPLAKAIARASRIIRSEYRRIIDGMPNDPTYAVRCLTVMVKVLREETAAISVLPEGAKKIPGFSDYCASRGGDVYTRNVFGSKGTMIGPWWKMSPINAHGNPRIVLKGDDGRKRAFAVAQIIMLAFVGPQPKGSHTRHLDGNPWNNQLENLRYGTPRENIMDAFRHGTAVYGERHPFAKLRNNQIPEIRRRLAAGDKQWDIARDFGVTQGAIACIARGQTWKQA